MVTNCFIGAKIIIFSIRCTKLCKKINSHRTANVFFPYLCVMKLILVVCLSMMSLVCNAKIALHDSLLDIRRAYTYNIISPDTAFAIIQAMREQHKIEPWRADMTEGDLHYNIRQFRKAMPFFEKALGSKAIKDSSIVQMMLLKRMMDCYDVLNIDGPLMEYIYQLRQKAEDAGDKHFEALSVFMGGKRLHLHGDKAKGYTYCLDAIEMMKQSKHHTMIAEMRAFYAELLKMYARDKRYDEALQVSKLQEEWASKVPPIGVGKAENRAMRRVYALRASLFAKMGRMADADEAYANWQQTTNGNAIDDVEILDYLMLSQHKEEALEVAQNYREFITSQGDTLSYRMLSVLNNEARIHLDLGDYAEAAMLGRKVGTIADSLRVKDSREEMSVTYDLITEQAASHRKTLLLSLSVVILSSLGILALVVLYYMREVRQRNYVLMKTLNSLDAYRRAVIRNEAASKEMAAVLQDDQRAKEDKQTEPDEDELLFVEIDKEITRDKLFLNPKFGRDMICKHFKLDKNRLGRIMSKYSEASNISVYINVKRVEYAAKLLLEHPEYTIVTIATECGMSNTVTFNRTFKDVFGVTPSEYRAKAGLFEGIKS